MGGPLCQTVLRGLHLLAQVSFKNTYSFYHLHVTDEGLRLREILLLPQVTL